MGISRKYFFQSSMDDFGNASRLLRCPADDAHREILAFDGFLELAGDANRRREEVVPVDLAALIYTSGSTGNPKGVMMTHQAMAFTAGSLIEYLRLDETDRILNPSFLSRSITGSTNC